MKFMLTATIFVVLSFYTLIPTNAIANDPCEALALHDVTADGGNAESVIKRGDYDTAITQYNVDKKTGATTFCSHGGSCYPTQVTIGGQQEDALKLTNCKIADQPYAGQGDEDQTTFGLVVDRSKFSSLELQYIDLDDRLSSLGLCSACTGGPAWYFLNQPKSVCAQLAKKALAGDSQALGILSGETDGPKCEAPDAQSFIGQPSAKRIAGDCRLVVDGNRLLDGPCPILIEKGGSFQIGITDDPNDLKYWAMLKFAFGDYQKSRFHLLKRT